ncbi:MAG: DUF3874 domain-containing protein [Prevotella sp.]|nr:DUF3874 domain-containing protein [Prevotella sp.]
MMKEITIIKNSRGTETLRATELHVLAEAIRSGEYQKEVNNLRTYYPLMAKERNEDGTLAGAEEQTRRLPRLCFASLLENRNQQRVRKAYTGMVLLEVDNLQSYEEAAAVRNGAALMPQTLMAFVGANGLSVEIICSGMLTTASEEALPQNADDIRTFHLNLYEKARLVYNGQLGVTIEKLEPHLERVCYMSTDRELFYNPAATPFYIELTTVDKAVGSKAATTIEARETAPGLDRYLTLHKIFEFNLMKAYDEMDTDEMFDAGDGQQQNEDELYTHLLAIRLASKCQQTGIPMSIALRMARAHSIFRKDMMLLRLVFENAYRKTNEKKYRSRKAISNPLKNIAPETLLTMKIDIFLREHYELRKNVMRGVAEYRQRSGLGFSFQDLTEEARNSMTLRALEQGIKCWDKDIRRFVNSDDIELYDPIGDWLEHLPRWDGKDRVTPLAQRVKTDYEDWTHLFHLWMRSMVAMWQGKGQLTGNALVPLLIGRQGCGKSSFCRILLPRDQREYYNDRINFKNESDLNLGLTSFALINLDEFDKITQRQQIVLKYLVSTADLKYRPPYGKAYSSHRRYASFIGTTNDQTPLVDPSGSRRFICVVAEGNIDFQTPIDYNQLYAQLLYEVAHGERYWLTKEEEQALMHHNLQYQRLNGLGEMLLSLYRRPEGDEEGRWLSLKDISARLKQAFRSSYKEESGTFEKIGNFLNRPEYKFQSRHRNTGTEYYVIEQ